ncbi:hypothetical protein DFH07DRAFT_766216 [Mycena maculata]|uniref:Uncharacterized protein n=1 Tax=Mycena maculata TaxID=230809 RepID=A0AAD7JNS1_9AGAR|nr:hypothetical protein DFH07DRAFT_769264 [Mycena maculata]KAJ7777999.1 hypothetical protein DFH07DRAFT_766216 [Mycena maculata]
MRRARTGVCWGPWNLCKLGARLDVVNMGSDRTGKNLRLSHKISGCPVGTPHVDDREAATGRSTHDYKVALHIEIRIVSEALVPLIEAHENCGHPTTIGKSIPDVHTGVVDERLSNGAAHYTFHARISILSSTGAENMHGHEGASAQSWV